MAKLSFAEISSKSQFDPFEWFARQDIVTQLILDWLH